MATEERGERLTVFNVNHKKTPTLAQITLELTIKKNISELNKAIDWIADEIKAEDDQWVFNSIFKLIFAKISTSEANSQAIAKSYSNVIKSQEIIKRFFFRQ